MKAFAALFVWAAVCLTATTAMAASSIVNYFRLYYDQQVVGASYQGPLDFLQAAATAHANAERVLRTSASRSVVIDPRNGYLRIDDGSGTDQALTMAIHLKADGSPLLVVGSSNCADACSFAIELFAVAGDHVQPVPMSAVMPTIDARQFIKPGAAMPEQLASLTPAINYLPAQVGTTLTLKPWYGYEVEEQMDAATRAMIRDVVLDWDAKQGRFVLRLGGAPLNSFTF